MDTDVPSGAQPSRDQAPGSQPASDQPADSEPDGGRPGQERDGAPGEATVLRMLLGAQLRRLRETANIKHVTLQVVPFDRGGHAGASGAFSILRFQEGDLPDVVYIEQLTSALYLDQRADVEHYLEVVDQLSGEALTPDETKTFIQQAAREA